MNSQPTSGSRSASSRCDRPTARHSRCIAIKRWLAVSMGTLFLQLLLYWPSLLGGKILLPLDLLTQRNHYVPRTSATSHTIPHDPLSSDMVLETEPLRQFAVSELYAGRLPVWVPGIFCGTPYYRWSFSPATLLSLVFATPYVLAVCQLMVSLCAALGAYAFCRGVLRVRFWPAAVVACCYPLTGAFIVWQGCGIPAVVCWLPWLLWAVDRSVVNPFGLGGTAVAAFTATVLLSGQTDVAGQTLLASGLFAVARWFQLYWQRFPSAAALRPLFVLAAGWILGITASLWLIMPLIDCARGGVRLAARSEGTEERPPVGLSALPQVLVPEVWGSTVTGSFYVARGNVPESAVGAYAGMVAALLAAPLAWCSRRHRTLALILCVLGVISLAWTFNLPGIVSLLRCPPLNMMSHNRFVFVAAFVILCQAAMGLDLLLLGRIRPRPWFALPIMALAIVVTGFLWGMGSLPEPVATRLSTAIKAGQTIGTITSAEGVAAVQRRFLWTYSTAALLGIMGLIGWVCLSLRPKMQMLLAISISLTMVVELLNFAVEYNAQCDRQLYYPSIPALSNIREAEPGRVIGYFCLPANLALMDGLRDVRGYDAIDPIRMVQLLGVAADSRSSVLSYAMRQWMTPSASIDDLGRLRLSPVLDMLNVRYVVFRVRPDPPLEVLFTSPDYFVVENQHALPRAYVPRSVETITDDVQRLSRLGHPTFDAREIAFVETDVDLPSECNGVARITEDTPQYVVIDVDMETAGCVVLADTWDPGWRAYSNGERVDILRVNHAIRGVLVPPGRSKLEFRYQPDSLTVGLRLLGIALCVWFGWIVWIVWYRPRTVDHSPMR